MGRKRKCGALGFTLIELLTVLAILVLLSAISVAALQAAREQARVASCHNNLRQIWIGVASYEISHGRLPTATFPYYSTFVTILPYVEHVGLYSSFDFEDLSSPLPKSRHPAAPAFLRCPSNSNFEESRINPDAMTSYLGSKGTAWLLGFDNGVFSDEHQQPKLAEIRDGLSNTIGFSEFASGTISNRIRQIDAEPNALTISIFDRLLGSAPALTTDREIGDEWYINGISKAYYTHYVPPGQKSGICKNAGFDRGAYTPSSNHSRRISSARADGSVSVITYGIDRNSWIQLGHRSDGGKTWF
jgi:prepilin-type N-terminal cleavage/methylation domain-containing protein